MEITAGGVALPSPTQIKIGEQIIWSSNTGRTANGEMAGDIIAEKATVAITWEMLTEAEKQAIKSATSGGFFSVSIASIPMDCYRSDIQSDVIAAGNETYYRTVTVSLIQK